VGSRCPSLLDARKVYGGTLIGLDGNLKELNAGSKFYPRTKSYGRYFYSRVGSLTRLLADLRAPDLDKKDGVNKLIPGDGMNLHGRVIVIHGVSKRTVLPKSVQKLKGETSQRSLPIADKLFS
jgi:hypothetical protein